MLYLILAFSVTFILCWILIRMNQEKFMDVSKGVQKFHTWNVPRTGGIAIFLSLVAVSIAFYIAKKSFTKEVVLLIISAVPVFLGGILEDITKKVSPRVRLSLGFLSGILSCFLLKANITRLDVPFLDSILKDSFVLSMFLSSFALAGISNAMNIIDGFNGLASGISVIIFLSYAYLSFLLGDQFLLYFNLVIFAAVVGFFLWNFPLGKIFLGDGGAYTLGFFAGLNGILLVNRHPQVSAWFPLLLLIYPIWETLFSIWRKKFARNLNPFEPDAIHFHMLVYKRIVKPKFKNIDERIRNSFTSFYPWLLQMVATIPALLFWNNKYLLMLFTIVFIVIYVWLYFRIVKFKIPKFLKV
jgi:UDP-N-acetylmuramyl pentapeptide phosphotransferase/UDP-N-acetylglucosamine-1-phosphate transferase